MHSFLFLQVLLIVSSPGSAKAKATAKMPLAGPPQECQLYAPDGVADLCSMLFKENFTISQHQAAARALLRHSAHIDGTDSHTCNPDGLHPLFFGFREETGEMARLSLMHEDFKEVCACNLFDTVHFSSTSCSHYLLIHLHPSQIIQQDHLDGRV